MASEGINMCEASEWYDFFSKNHLNVFDVLHGALSVAVLYWPDDFIKKRDHIVQFLNARKPFKHKNKNAFGSGSGPGHDDDLNKCKDDTESADTIRKRCATASEAFPEPPLTKTDQKHMSCSRLVKKETEELITVKTEKLATCPAAGASKEETLTTRKTVTTRKIGLGRRLVKKEENTKHLLLGNTIKKEDVVSRTRSVDKEANTTSGIKKDDSIDKAKIKLQTTDIIHDEAALERKLEAAKRKLHDGYKNAEAAKKRIRLIEDATDIPKQRNIVTAVNCTSRIRAN